MSVTPSPRQLLIDDMKNKAHALADAVENYERKMIKNVDLINDLGLTLNQVNTRLLPRIKPLVADLRTSINALVDDLRATDPTIP
jgi:hypothetical protein